MNQDQINPSFAPVWGVFLTIASTAGSLLFACATPFAAVAAIAALTLPARLALIATMAVWLGNQAVGFLVLGYPLTASSLAWGPVLGGSAILAAAAGIYVARGFDRADLRRWPAVFAASLAVQQALVLAAGLAEGSASLNVAAGVSALNAVWFLAFAVIFRLVSGVVGSAAPAPATAR